MKWLVFWSADKDMKEPEKIQAWLLESNPNLYDDRTQRSIH